MKDSLHVFTANPDTTILDALRKIDKNRNGFLIIIDASMKVLGTLTDGDIRRAFIRGVSVEGSISGIFVENFKSLYISDGIAEAIEIFKNESIKFLPILDNEGKLANIITKNQVHALLLQDLHVDLSYDFMSLDPGIVDYEIFLRPWGFFKTTVMNDYFQSKIICVNPGGQLSLQSHNHREEHWIIAHGTGKVQLDQTILDVHCGSSVFIPKGCRHRLTNNDQKETLIVTEVQIGDYFGEDDIIRYEDVYGRV